MANPQNTITEIKNFFSRHNGLQRDNRYSISFLNLPSALPQVPDQDLYSISFGSGARAIDGIADNLMGYGPGRIIPRSQKFVGGILLTFPLTNDSFLLNFFNNWFNLIYSGGRVKGNYNEPFMLNYYDNIVANTKMKLKILDPNGNTNRVMTFYEIFPLEALPLEFDMMKQNEYLKYQVMMYYREFTLGDR